MARDDSPEAQVKRLEAAWAHPKGWRYFSDVNNSVVGLWYIVAAFAFMLFGGVLALIIRRAAGGARERPRPVGDLQPAVHRCTAR